MEAVNGHLIGEIVSRGSGDAKRALYERCVSQVYGQCRGYHGITAEDAEDIVQDVFITVFAKLHTLKDHAKFFSWLHAITRNRCLQVLKKRLRRNMAEQGYGSEMELNLDTPRDYLMREQETRVVQELIASVKKREMRETAELFYMQGLSCEEISEKKGIKVTTVTTRLSRFRARVQRELIRRVLELRSENE